MRKLVVLTAYDRPEYLLETLRSWREVDFTGWDFMLRLEPSYQTEEQVSIFHQTPFLIPPRKTSLVLNGDKYGVLLHPFVAFQEAFTTGYDFVVRAEDDLLVSRDILQFFDYAAESFQSVSEVASVHAYSPVAGDRFEIRPSTAFNPLVWGTWADRWAEYIGPTWDKDYSTNNGTPGVHAGWDWNLNERILPGLDKQIIRVERSRVQNIGVFGTHATPENFEQAPEWEADYGTGRFWLDERRCQW